MKRRKFISTTIKGGLALSLISHYSFSTFQEDYSTNQLIGKDESFIVGNSYTTKMHQKTAEAFQKMKTAALKDNISIELVSAYRSFDRQKQIFEKKYLRYTNQGLSPIQAIRKIIEYSTIPGTSRHHWGTDIDIIDANAPRPKNVLEPQHFHGNGPFCKLKEWLNKHAETYGFHEVYTNEPNRKGFKYEPWHFSYAPVSIPMLRAYKKLEVKKILQNEKIEGSMHFTDDFINQYRNENILDINKNLL